MIGEVTKQKVRTCICENKYQDAIYGPFNRLHNISQKENQNPKGWRCTACGRLNS